MQGLLEEGEQIIQEEEGDAALICAAQKVEHYEIAAYGSLAAWAKLLGETEAAELLGESLEEEKQADEKLTQIAESTINVEESESSGEEEAPSRRLGQRGHTGRQTAGRRSNVTR
jgi:ferritin-like metal-binding protein YciE